jgi:hypothetical protein
LWLFNQRTQRNNWLTKTSKATFSTAPTFISGATVL